MFVNLAVLACTLGVALGAWNGPLAGGTPAHQYPAGVSPQACPNFPNCNNPAVAANPSAPAYGGYNPGAYNPGAYNPPGPGAYNGGYNNALDSGTYTGDGDYHGEGLAEAGAYGNVDGNQWNQPAPAWNQPQAPSWNQPAPAWNQPAPAWNAAPGHAPAAVPAGVDPHSCPNYPFCA